MSASQKVSEEDYERVPGPEIFGRIRRFQQHLGEENLDGALILDGVNLFYFTGTMQQGVLFLPRIGDAVFFVRRSLERAQQESPIHSLIPVKRFDDVSSGISARGYRTNQLGLDYATTPVSLYRKMSAIFPHVRFEDMGPSLALMRSEKTPYEVGLIRESGIRHGRVFEMIPGLVTEGMTEWELGTALHGEMLKLGFTGLMRLASYNGELFAGVVSFGESGNYPTSSVGPDGIVGLGPAFPFLGGRKRLTKEEIIFVDTGFSFGGYYTDMTRIFCLGRPSQIIQDAHGICLKVQEAVRKRLRPGAIPGEIFDEVDETIVRAEGFEENFMGYGSNRVPFLGHGIGLVVDEFPAIATKIRMPLKENMVIAVEPKKGLKDVGLVGIENTFLVTEEGGEKLTFGSDEIVAI
jgi:Xaa-Pro aminopeptidase